jgi:23S rRNA (adenine1618-N6)-methyltransferase
MPEQTAKAFVAPDLGSLCRSTLSPLNHFVAETLVGAFEVVVLDGLLDRQKQRRLSEADHSAETFLLETVVRPTRCPRSLSSPWMRESPHLAFSQAMRMTSRLISCITPRRGVPSDDMNRRSPKEGLHPRNRFRDGYDFDALVACSPALAGFVGPNAHGNTSIDYADPEAVKALNQALLGHAYQLHEWDLQTGSLCPPIPGRSEHLHHLADLLGCDTEDGQVPRGPTTAVLDIGTGASCIYPLIGARDYGWRFVGTEVDPAACRWATGLVAAHPEVTGLIEIRQQSSALQCFEGVVQTGDAFALSMCNPPFHASAEEAAEGNRRKLHNLGSKRRGKAGKRLRHGQGDRTTPSVRNFGGQAGELWCPGGELGFVQRMITQSAERPTICRWFTTLVSRGAHLPRLKRALQAAEAAEVRVLEMAHGQKQSRILAWTFRKP